MASERRQFLRVIAVAGVSGLAGCGDSDTSSPNQQTTSPTPEGSSQPTGTPTSDQIPDDVLTETTELSPESTPAGAFGRSLAISGDGSTAVIGSLTQPNWGFVFEKQNGSWKQQATLDIDVGKTPYGVSVGLSDNGEVATVGGFNGRSGRAVAFRRAGGAWDRSVELDPRVSVRDGLTDFGRTIAMSNDGSTILVGGIHNAGGGEGGEGTVFVFTENREQRWFRDARLNAPGDGFGGSVALSNDGSTALVGAWNDSDPNGFNTEKPGSGAGSAYVLTVSDGGWTRQSKLFASDGDPDDHFGSNVALSADGTTALISAFNDEHPNGTSSGSAYVFSKHDSSWEEETKLVAADGDQFDQFGSAVALSGDGRTALVGASTDDDPNGSGSDDRSGAGAAYLFRYSNESWEQHAKFAAEGGDHGDYFGESGAIDAAGDGVLVGATGDEDAEGENTGSVYSFSGYS